MNQSIVIQDLDETTADWISKEAERLRAVLLDTNAYTALKRGVLDAIEIVEYAPIIGINSIILGELLSGFADGITLGTSLSDFIC